MDARRRAMIRGLWCVLAAIVVITVTLSIAAISKTAPPPRAVAAPTIHIKDYAFSPATIAIKPGQRVTWVNDDSVRHTVTADNGKWGSARLGKGETYSYTFTKAGTMPYHCTIHKSMKGKVVVKK